MAAPIEPSQPQQLPAHIYIGNRVTVRLADYNPELIFIITRIIIDPTGNFAPQIILYTEDYSQGINCDNPESIVQA